MSYQDLHDPTPVEELHSKFAAIKVDTNLWRSVTLYNLLIVVDTRHYIKAELFTDFGLTDQLELEKLRNEEYFVMNLILKTECDFTVRDFIEILSRHANDICYRIVEKQYEIMAEYEKYKIKSNYLDDDDDDDDSDDDQVDVKSKLLSKKRRLLQYIHEAIDKFDKNTALLVYTSSENDSELKRIGIHWFKKKMDNFGLKFKEFVCVDCEIDDIQKYLVNFDYIFILYDQELAVSLDGDSGKSEKYAELGRCLYEEYIEKREDGEYTRFYTFLIDYHQDVEYHWLHYTRYLPFKKIDDDKTHRKEVVKILQELCI